MRKWIERVLEWDPLIDGEWHTVRVNDVTKCAEPQGMVVTLQFVDDPHAGRVEKVFLRRPIRPAGPSIEFVRAAGLLTATFEPKDAVGATVRARFSPSPDGTSWVAVGFEPVAAGTEPAGPA